MEQVGNKFGFNHRRNFDSKKRISNIPTIASFGALLEITGAASGWSRKNSKEKMICNMQDTHHHNSNEPPYNFSFSDLLNLEWNQNTSGTPDTIARSTGPEVHHTVQHEMERNAESQHVREEKLPCVSEQRYEITNPKSSTEECSSSVAVSAPRHTQSRKTSKGEASRKNMQFGSPISRTGNASKPRKRHQKALSRLREQVSILVSRSMVAKQLSRVHLSEGAFLLAERDRLTQENKYIRKLIESRMNDQSELLEQLSKLPPVDCGMANCAHLGGKIDYSK